MDEIGALNEICRLAVLRGKPKFSRFLDLAGQKDAVTAARSQNAQYKLYGGREDCERKMLGAALDEAPDAEQFPITCVRVSPRGAKFAREFGHRDVLGSLMGLGIDRDVIGDIVLHEGTAYVFCLSNMAEYIISSLEKVGCAFVECDREEPSPNVTRNTRQMRLQVSSVRLDAIVARLFSLSRTDAQTLFRQRKIFVDDSVCERTDYIVKEGQIISARGFGRAKYVGVEGRSKKGKLNLLIELYA